MDCNGNAITKQLKKSMATFKLVSGSSTQLCTLLGFSIVLFTLFHEMYISYFSTCSLGSLYVLVEQTLVSVLDRADCCDEELCLD